MVSKYCSYDEENEKLWVCVDFRDLNVATLQDMYVMSIYKHVS